ncbi:MAG: threonine synthase [Opitutales bacterium]|nr:threonine synthase [Opitutales bacterium]
MKFVSTRGSAAPLGFSAAVEEGLAPDGGLYVPETFPKIDGFFDEWEKLDYPSLCFEFLKLFASDIPECDLKKVVFASYKKFDDVSVAPLKKLNEKLYVLELFHGPTLAFKDFALQLLGNLYEYLLAKSNRTINVLGATSGDTGSAAINGLLGKKGVNIFILYPHGRVSPLQERQMTCTGAKNVFPIAIDGTFDDAQFLVKSLFGDVEFKRKWRLSAVNSINLARILAQCVYYIYAYLKIEKSQRQNVLFTVPTGNFGNVLAGWFAYKMGMKVAGFKVATNQNDILHRLFTSGVYKLGDVVPSYAPSMDIQVASNFERFIYYLENENAEKVCEIMQSFKRDKIWKFDNFCAPEFSSSKMDDAQIPQTVKRVYEKFGYVVDPHTACAFADVDKSRLNILISTASPAKFPDLIIKAIGIEPKSPILEELKTKEIITENMPANEQTLRNYIEQKGLKNGQ